METPDTAPSLRLPILLATPCGRFLSVIALSAKRRGWVQRTLFTEGEGASTDDQHVNAEDAVARALHLGFTVVTCRALLPRYMPRR